MLVYQSVLPMSVLSVSVCQWVFCPSHFSFRLPICGAAVCSPVFPFLVFTCQGPFLILVLLECFCQCPFCQCPFCQSELQLSFNQCLFCQLSNLEFTRNNMLREHDCCILKRRSLSEHLFAFRSIHYASCPVTRLLVGYLGFMAYQAFYVI